MSDLILALDLGTSGLKAVVFSAEGRIVAEGSASYETRYGESGEAEQDAADWWRAVRDAVAGLEPPGVPAPAALAISGHMMGVVPVDAEGEPLGRALIHADTRAVGQADELANAVGLEQIYRITGHRASASYSGPKMMWLAQNDPERYNRAAALLNPKDYLNLRLTGRTCTEYTDASGTLLYDLERGDWSRELVAASGLDASKLPEIVPSAVVIGRVTRAAAAETGLPEGLPVVAGAGDGMCAGVGAGSVAAGLAYNYLGTTSWVATTADRPLIDPEMRTFTFAHAVPGLYHSMGTMQTAGGAVDWFCDTTLGHLGSREEALRRLDDLVAESPPGSRGLTFLPYLLGERSPWWNPNCSGGWVGLRQIHSLSDQARSVLEGVAGNLAIIADALTGLARFGSLRLLGGGGLSRHWPQILCDAYDRPLTVLPATRSATARGAAIIAGVGVGLYKDFSVAESMASGGGSQLSPSEEGARVMKDVRRRLVDAFTRLHGQPG